MTNQSIINRFVVLKTATYGLVIGFFEEASSSILLDFNNKELLIAVVVALVCLAIEIGFNKLECLWSTYERKHQKKILLSELKELEDWQKNIGLGSENYQEIDIKIKKIQRNITALITDRAC